MIAHETNLFLLTAWSLAWGMAGPAMLRPFGLAAAEITTIAAGGAPAWRHWSAVPTVIATPRRTLLPALEQGAPGAVLRHVAEGRGPCQQPAPARLAEPVNLHLLFAWRQVAGSGDAARLFGLRAEDGAALSRADDDLLRHWAALPVAVAVPTPGLLPALLRQDSHHLFVELVRAGTA